MRAHKLAKPCDNCGNTYFDKLGGWSFQPPEWECTNCCQRRPRRVMSKSTGISRTQLHLIRQIRDAIAASGNQLFHEDISMIEGSDLLSYSGTWDRAREGKSNSHPLTETYFHVILGQRGRAREASWRTVGYGRNCKTIGEFIGSIH